ncbi:MAG: hypothetical protein RMK99_11305 [Anaerolineales bacterium]|nr:hypothetical protein [Anaerolineales bacterium]
MQRGRLLIIVALILIILSVCGVFVLLNLNQAAPPGNGQTPTGPEVIEVTQPPPARLELIGTGQNLSRGQVIPTEAIIVMPWPADMAPPSALTDPNQVVGRLARYDIPRNSLLLSTMLVVSPTQVSRFGSDAALLIPPGFTAISIPYDRKSGVAFGIRDGDYVNVIVSWALVDIDEEFQTVLPNLTAGVLPAEAPVPGPEGSGITQASIVAAVTGAGPGNLQGRVETDPVLNQPFYVVPSEPQRARLVSQSIIQNALVLRVGDFGPIAPVFAEPTPTPAPPDPNATPTPPPPPTPTPPPPDLITLVVSPQDALVLNYVMRMMERYPDAIKITLTLRPPGDQTIAETQSVTMQYMFERFNISLPAKLNYGLDTRPLPSVPAAAPTTP